MQVDSLEVVVQSSTAKANAELDKLIAKLQQVSGAMMKTSATNMFTGVSEKGISGASNGLKSFTSYAGKARKSTLSLASAFGKFYANCFLFIRGIKSLGKAIESTMDYIETYNYYNVIMDKIGSEFGKDWKENGYNSAEEYAESFKNRLNGLTTEMTGYKIGDEGGLYDTGSIGLGLDPEAIMNYQASISSITNAVGLTGEVSTNTSKALTMLAADMSSLKNQDLQSVMTNLQSGLIGQSRALYKYGIDITNATLQEYAYANGVSKAVSEMTQSEKMQLRMIAIMDQSKVAWGDMANTINGVANQYRLFKQQISNLARTIGALFLPVIQAALPYINGFIIALQRMFTWLGNMLGVDWSNLMDGISSGYSDTGLEDLADSAEDTADNLDNATKAAKKLKTATLGIDELNINSKDDDSASSGSGSGSGAGGAVDLSGALASALAEYQSIWDKAMAGMDNKANGIADKITGYFKKIHDAWVTDADMTFIGQDIANALNNLLYAIDWDSIKNIAYKIGKSISTALSGFLNSMDWKEVGNAIAQALNSYVQFWKGAIENFDFKALGTAMAESVNGFFENFEFKELGSTISKAIKGALLTVSTFFKKTDFQNIGDKIGEFIKELDFAGIASSLAEVLWEATKAAFDLFGGLFTEAPLETSLLVAFGVMKFTKVGALIGGKIATAISTGLGAALVSIGGIGGLLTMDVATIIGAGTLAEIGLAAGTAIIGGIAAAILGWNLGQALNEAVTGEEIDLSFSEQMSEIKSSFTDGSWSEALKLWGQDISDNFSAMGNDIGLFFSGIWTNITTIFSGIGEWFNTNVITPVSEFFSGLKEDISEKFSQIKEDVTGAFSEAWKDIKNVWGNVTKWFDENIITPVSEAFSGFSETVSSILEGLWIIIQAVWIVVSEWFDENVINPIKKNFDVFKTTVSGFFTTLWNNIKTTWNEACSWFDTNVITPIKNSFDSFKTTVSGFFTSLWEGIKETWNSASTWFKDNVTDKITKKFEEVKTNVSQYFTDLWSGITKTWKDAKKWFKDTVIDPVEGAWKTATDNISGFFTTLWGSITTGVKSAFKAVVKSLENMVNKIIDGVNVIIKGFSKVVNWGAKVAGKKWDGIDTIEHVTLNVDGFKTGGFPEDGLFMANHNELVGKFSNGKTAVANNEQIVSGITAGVQNGMRSEEQVELLQEQNSLLKQILAKNPTTILDGRTLTTVVNNTNKRNGITFTPQTV